MSTECDACENKKADRFSRVALGVLISVIVAMLLFVGSIAITRMMHECLICEKAGLLYNYVTVEGTRYYACPEHEETLARVAKAYMSGKAWAESFYGAYSDAVEFMFGSFLDSFDSIYRGN